MIFDNSAHSGKVTIDLKATFHHSPCGDAKTGAPMGINMIMTLVLDVIILLICCTSILLCSRSLWRAQKLRQVNLPPFDLKIIILMLLLIDQHSFHLKLNCAVSFLWFVPFSSQQFVSNLLVSERVFGVLGRGGHFRIANPKYSIHNLPNQRCQFVPDNGIRCLC